jgi:DNA methylase
MVALNAICPYFTMFPLDFPKGILDRHAKREQRVLDPFCGRGTTNFAARLSGLDTLGVDSNSVAAAVTAAKLVPAKAKTVVSVAQNIIESIPSVRMPQGEFWELAYHQRVLQVLCRLRKALLADCSSDTRVVLRGLVLGALHGPLRKGFPGYLSNQCTRTFAPKPNYAIRYWRSGRQTPPSIDVLDVIRRRAERYLATGMPTCRGESRLGDSRDPSSFSMAPNRARFDWVITSPPYYGMRTYVQDQWLRHWFLGGPELVDYSTNGQLDHTSPDCFSAQLSRVWTNIAGVCHDNARLVIRFGGIRDRNVHPLDLVKHSLRGSAWQIATVRQAGTAESGRRQAHSFLKQRSVPMNEYDIWARIT